MSASRDNRMLSSVFFQQPFVANRSFLNIFDVGRPPLPNIEVEQLVGGFRAG